MVALLSTTRSAGRWRCRRRSTPHNKSMSAQRSCTSSSTTTLTGNYAQRYRLGVEEPLGPNTDHWVIPEGTTTIASVFRDRGYYTALVGKWHLGDPPVSGPLQHGYDDFYGLVEGAGDYFRHRMVMGGNDIGMGLTRGNEPLRNQEGYLTDMFGDETIAAIERAGDRPFFISLHFNAPHWPWEGREDAEVARLMNDFTHLDGGTIETFANMVSAMDDNIGKVLAALREIGELDNTLIVFTSDNGGERFSDTWPFVGMKGELLEGGIRVPLLAQWPGRIAPGTRSDQVAISMDFLPTFAAMAGGSLPEDTYDGIDLGPQMFAGADAVERTLFWRQASSGGMAAVRKGDWKYLATGDEEHLFNLAIDPRERANRKDAEPELFRQLRSEWNAWNAEMLPYPIGSYRQDNREFFSDRY